MKEKEAKGNMGQLPTPQCGLTFSLCLEILSDVLIGRSTEVEIGIGV